MTQPLTCALCGRELTDQAVQHRGWSYCSSSCALADEYDREPPVPTRDARDSVCRCGGLCDSGQPCPMANY